MICVHKIEQPKESRFTQDVLQIPQILYKNWPYVPYARFDMEVKYEKMPFFIVLSAPEITCGC